MLSSKVAPLVGAAGKHGVSPPQATRGWRAGSGQERGAQLTGWTSGDVQKLLWWRGRGGTRAIGKVEPAFFPQTDCRNAGVLVALPSAFFLAQTFRFRGLIQFHKKMF